VVKSDHLREVNQTLTIVPWRKKLRVAHRLGSGLPEEGLEVTARQQLQDDEPADKWIDGSTRLPVSGPSGFAQLGFAVTFCWSNMERLLRHIYICTCICTPTVLLSAIHLWWRALYNRPRTMVFSGCCAGPFFCLCRTLYNRNGPWVCFKCPALRQANALVLSL
jgi:hypothetical protein